MGKVLAGPLVQDNAGTVFEGLVDPATGTVYAKRGRNLQVAATGDTAAGEMVLYDPSGNPITIQAVGADAESNTASALLGEARLYDYNGVGWDRHRGNTESILLASAARTALATSATQKNYNARGVVLVLDVTANPGGTETLAFSLGYVDATIGTSFFPPASFSTQAAVNGTYRLIAYPGFAGVLSSPNNNKGIGIPVSRFWISTVTPSGAGSWTYSLSCMTIL